jgi:phage-related protein (TIGR01555 family)
MPKPSLSVVRNDSFANLATELGTTGDKREYAGFVYESLDVPYLEELYAQDDMAGRICELLPETMLREGYDLALPEESDGKAVSDTILDALDGMGADEAVQTALEFMRCSGGAVILLGVDDGSADPRMPLNLNTVRALEWLTVLMRGEIRPYTYYTDPRSPKFGLPELYEVTNTGSRSSILTPAGIPAVRDVTVEGELIHESRLIRVDGFRLPKRLRRDRDGWGGAVLERSYKVVRDFQMSWAAAAILLQEFGLMLFKIDGLAGLVNAGNNQVVVNRARQIAIGKSTARAIISDSKEQIERMSTQTAGLPEMLQQLALRLAASARYPVSLLMGQQPSGLNATGAADIRNYYDHAKNGQVRPIVNRIVEVLMRSKQGPTNGKLPARWWVSFRPMWQMTEDEKSTIMARVATADAVYLANGVLMPEEVALSRFTGEGGFSLSVQLDTDTRKAMETADELLTDEQEAAATAAGVGAEADPEAVDPQSALNGAQVTAALDIVSKVALGQLPRDTGVNMLTAFFPLSPAQANKVMGSVGRGFTIEQQPPAAAPRSPNPAMSDVRLNSADIELLSDAHEAEADSLRLDAQEREDDGKFGGSDGAPTAEEQRAILSPKDADTYTLALTVSRMWQSKRDPLRPLHQNPAYVRVAKELKKRGIKSLGQIDRVLSGHKPGRAES